MEDKVVLKCKASTDASKLAGSIYSTYVESKEITLRVIGAGALNQAIKAAIICNRFLAKNGITVHLKPSFQDTENNITAIELRLYFVKE